MKLSPPRPLLFALFALACLAHAGSAAAQSAAQSEAALRIAEVGPYDRVAPGQIVELRVEGFAERFIAPPADGGLLVLVTQDGSTKTARARTASPVIVREGPPATGAGSSIGMKMFQGITFAVPRGLRAGEAEVVVSYMGRRSAPFKLNITERPGRPVVGSTGVVTIAPASLPPPPAAGTPATRSAPGLRFERGAKGVEMHVRPLADPDDAEAGVLVRFKQGGTFYDANARVVHREGGRQEMPGGAFRLAPARDVLEIDVPEMLAPGEAEAEVRLRAAGMTGEPVLVPVTVTDAGRAFEAPKDAAPRMLAVTPRRVGAGQALMISVDRRRALDPNPDKVEVVFETPDGAWSFKVRPEKMSTVRLQATTPDAPVLLIVRAPKQITGDVRVRVHNPARADYEGASSEPAMIEIVSEPVAPEVESVGEASEAELSQLRQIISSAQATGLRVRPAFEPGARYVSIRAAGLDPDPRYRRVRFEQEGRAPVTLEHTEVALYSNGVLLVRLPKGFGAGRVSLSVENRGASGYSAPAVKTFELPERR
ncbi:MAG TPA: hypothetical protein VGB98_01795 [Pyrinomonadaceae bacterium]|jgi:hypothetical protein